jgi:RES domain
LYGSELLATASAEIAWWRWHDLAELAPREPAWPDVSYTFFRVSANGQSVDLRHAPFDRDGAVWMHSVDYTGTQRFAREARTAGVDLILYHSVRDPDRGLNCAVMTERAVGKVSAESMHTQLLHVDRAHASWIHNGALERRFSVEPWGLV